VCFGQIAIENILGADPPDNSGIVRLPVKAARELESMPQQLAEPPSAPDPVEVEGGEIGSLSSLLAVALLSAPGGHVDPVSVIETGQTSFQPNAEFMREIQPTLNQAVCKDVTTPIHILALFM